MIKEGTVENQAKGMRYRQGARVEHSAPKRKKVVCETDSPIGKSNPLIPNFFWNSGVMAESGSTFLSGHLKPGGFPFANSGTTQRQSRNTLFLNGAAVDDFIQSPPKMSRSISSTLPKPSEPGS